MGFSRENLYRVGFAAVHFAKEKCKQIVVPPRSSRSNLTSSPMKFNLTLLRRVVLFLGMAMVVSTVSATDVPKNLGNDLDKLVESNLAIKRAQQSGNKIVTYNGFASERAAMASDMAIREPSTNKYLVTIHPSGRVKFEQLKADLLKSCPSLRITGTDPKYKRVGVLEGFISIDQVATVANNKGVQAVTLGIKPYVKRSKGGRRSESEPGSGSDVGRHSVRPGCYATSRRQSQHALQCRCFNVSGRQRNIGWVFIR